MVVSLAYVLYVDDEIADSDRCFRSTGFYSWTRYIIPGLERELTG
jgi:hypothetical protein